MCFLLSEQVMSKQLQDFFDLDIGKLMAVSFLHNASKNNDCKYKLSLLTTKCINRLIFQGCLALTKQFKDMKHTDRHIVLIGQL